MSKKDQKTLFKWIWHSYARTAIIPLVVIELVFLGIYFTSNEWVKEQNTTARHAETNEHLQELAGLEAEEIQQELQDISYLTTVYSKQTASYLAKGASALSPDDQSRLAYSANGEYYTTRDSKEGGAAIFYSGYVPIGEKEREKVAKLLPMQTLMKDFEQSHPLVASIYFNTYDSLNIIYPYFDVLGQYVPKMDIPSFNFYYEADETHNPERKPKWTDVYLDPAGHGWMISSIAPVYKGDTLEGVVGLDITVDTIINSILSANIPWGGYAMLVGRDGTIIALPEQGEKDWGLEELTDHSYEEAVLQDTSKPDQFNLYKREDTSSILGDLRYKESGILNMKLNDRKQVISWSTIPETNWKIMFVVEEGNIYERINAFNKALNHVGAVMSIGLVLFYFLFFAWLYRRAKVMSVQIARPLSDVNAGLQRIAEGDYSANLDERHYEVEEFEKTKSHLNHLGEELSRTKEGLLLANNEIQQRENNLRALIDSIDDVILEVDMQGNIVNVLIQDESKLLMAASELTGKNVNVFISSEAEGKVLAIMEQIKELGKPQTMELYSASMQQWYEARIALILNHQTGRYETFSVVIRNITEQKKAASALVESEARKSAILESALDGVIIMDSDGMIREFNPAAERIFNYEKEQVIGRSLSDAIIPPQYREAHRAGMKRYLATGEARVLGKRIEVTAMRSDGTEFPMELSITKTNVEGPSVFSAYVRDITQAKQDKEFLIQAKEEAEKANKAKSEFLSQMSHELRTPLNAVLGFAQILDFDPAEPLTRNQKESVDEIQKAGKHLLELINQVLDLSRIEAGDLTVSMEPIEMKPLLEECLHLISPLAAAKNIKVELKPVKQSLWVKADRTRLKQVLLNLLSNAVKYNHENGSIILYCESQHSGMLKLSIRDTGYGIPSKDLRKIFEPFHRNSYASRFAEGTGIGLTVAKQLMELMNGEIGVESTEGEGSTFWIRIPTDVYSSISIDETALLSAEHLRVHTLHRQYTVLYVEDNPANLNLVTRMMKTLPEVELLTANNAEAGIDLAIRYIPDLVLMDINLPDIDGFEALARLQALEQTSRIPVIAVSANAMPDDLQQGRQAGFAAYITKPIVVQEFLKTVYGFLSSEDKE